jgi:hypothetical protein
MKGRKNRRGAATGMTTPQYSGYTINLNESTSRFKQNGGIPKWFDDLVNELVIKLTINRREAA